MKVELQKETTANGRVWYHVCHDGEVKTFYDTEYDDALEYYDSIKKEPKTETLKQKEI